MSESSSGKQEERQAPQTLCPVIRRFLPLLALQELRPSLERAVYLHLARCESCTDELAKYEAVTQLLRANWKHSDRRKSPDSSNTPYIITNHEGQSFVSDPEFEPFPHQDDSIPEAPPRNTALPPPSPNDVDAEKEAKGAMAFARRYNKEFRYVFAEALVEGKHISPFPQTDDASEHGASGAYLSSKGMNLHRQAENDAPSDAFTTAVKRSLAAIAQQWHDPEHQSDSEDHNIC